MKLFSILALTLLVVAIEGAVTVCPKEGSISEGRKYHADTLCDRTSYNHFKSTLGRHDVQRRYRQMGGISTVPNQKTVTCPAGGARVNMKDSHAPNVGQDTVWFIENRASTPVVVGYVDGSGNEVSARNPKISPPIADPKNVIKPNSWMAVHAFEGHEFVVREVLKSGVAGNVLLQHRVGLIPVGANMINNIACPKEDIEPKIDENTTAPVFQRTPTAVNRPCNTLDIGFRNVASCPLHGYFVSGEGESCREEFKLHLGVQSITSDFIHDWVSQTKYEGSFIGHTFHFRLASNPSILVDTITLQPVIVTDCPMSSAAAIVAEQSDVGIMAMVSNAEFSNTTDMYDMNLYESLYSTNTTIGRTFDKPVALTI
jgi:hypothetical protein